MKHIHQSCILIFLFLLTSTNLYTKNTVIATIAVGINPMGIATAPHNHHVYVANNNNSGITNQNSVDVICNIENNTLETIYDNSFNQPYKIAISPNGKRAYVTNNNSTTVSVIKTKHNNVIDVINGFDGPSGIVITPNNKFAYVANYGSAGGVGSGNGTTVNMVDLKTNTIIGEPIIVGLAPIALAISRDGEFVYVINYANGTPASGSMSVIKTKNNTVTETITGFFGPADIAVTPNGKYAYITNFGSNSLTPNGTTVSVVKLHNHLKIVDTIELGIQPSGIAVTPNGHFVYVTNYNTLSSGAGQGTVNIINTHTNKVIFPTIMVGESPKAIAISRHGKRAYVTNYTSNSVSVIELKD